MPIILAIEPDQRQAAHLTDIVRRQVGAELILSATIERALASIGDRIPDIVLVPASLSPQDDAVLGAALRVIAVAAHIRTVTTPLLSSGDGHCHPAVFAERLAACLRGATAERTGLAAAPDVPSPAAAGATAAAGPLEATASLPPVGRTEPPDDAMGKAPDVWHEPSPVAPPHVEWTELVASLRQDIEQRRARPAPAAPSGTAIVSAAGAEPSGLRPNQRGRPIRPVQDEWGFFDPEQCGFAALLAKLEEMASGQATREKPDEPGPA
jgi:hypothetical protein